MLHKIAIIGCGGVAPMHLEGCRRHAREVQVVAACDPNEMQRQKTQVQFGIEDGFSSLQAAIDGADWDAAIVCTPTSVRGEVVETLARAGKAIFVEKPLASSYEEARAMVEICRRHNVPLAVDQNFRFHFPFAAARQRIARGDIGTVTQIAHRDWFFRQDGGWRIAEKRHAMMVMGVHWLDGLRWMVPGQVTTVNCRTHSSTAIDCEGETEAIVQLSYDNGAIASYTQSFSSALSETSTLVTGETGTLALHYSGLTLHRRGQAPQHEDNAAFAGDNKPESAFAGLSDLLQSLESGDEAPNSGRDNLLTMSLLEAAYRSAQEKRIIELHNGLLP